MAQWQTRANGECAKTQFTALVLVLAILLLWLVQAECPLGEIFFATLRTALGALPAALLAAWQVLQGHECPHVSVWQGLAQTAGDGLAMVIAAAL